MILAIDTTHEFGSIALLDKGEILEETELHTTDSFSQIIFGEISAILDRHGRTIHDVTCFASASGPGTFTGVRVGLACIKGLAEAACKPVAAVSNLQALAAFGSGPVRATVLDARRGEIYGGLYDAGLRPLAPEVVMKFSDWQRTFPAGPVELIAPDLAELPPPRIIAPRVLAGAIARIAAVMLHEGRVVDPAQVDANYVRRADAELQWKDPLSPGPAA